MQAVSFSIRRVNRLRRAAAKARMVPAAEDPDLSPEESLSDGWSASAYDTNTLMRVFDTLWLKAGFALHAYVFRAGSNGNGIIMGGAGRCPAGYAWRLSQARRHVAATPAAAGGRPAHASHRGRRQSLVLPVCIDPESRGCGIRGRLARLRLERPDDSLQASAAGRWPRCVGRRADADRQRPRQQLDVARCGSSHVDADVYRQGTDQGRRPAHPRIATPSCWPGIGRARWLVSGTCPPVGVTSGLSRVSPLAPRVRTTC